MKKTGAHLKTDGKHKEDKAELLDKMQHVQVHLEAQMPHQDAQKQDPGGAQGDAFYLETAQKKSNADNKCKQHDAMGDAVSEKQIFHSQYSSFTTKQDLPSTRPSTYQEVPSCRR